MTSSITRSPIGAQDLYPWDGDEADIRFARTTQEGYTINLNPVFYQVDALVAFGGGVNYNYDTLYDCVTAQGSDERDVILRPGTWDIDTNLTIAANINLVVPNGVMLTPASGITVTINGTVTAGPYQWIDESSGGTVTLNSYPQDAAWKGSAENLSVTGLTINGTAFSPASYVAKSLFDANTILSANADNTPAALTVAEQRLVGRITGGNIDDLTTAQVVALLATDSSWPKLVQVVNALFTTKATGTTAMPCDDTIPQNTEGDEYMTLAITPKSASNYLIIQVLFQGARGVGVTNSMIGVALFQDSTAAALNAAWNSPSTTTDATQISLAHYMIAGTASSTTFKVRAGNHDAGTTTFNGMGGNRYYGGVLTSSITIWEIGA